MEVRAKAKFIRMSPKKIRLIIDVVRGMDVDVALNQLRFIPKAAALPVSKLIDSAIANAHHNFSLLRSNLYIKEIRADMGPVLKRWSPRAFGRAAQIRKRMSHITLVLGERVATVRSEEKTKKDVSDVASVVTDTENNPKKLKKLERGSMGGKDSSRGMGKRQGGLPKTKKTLFNRKAQ